MPRPADLVPADTSSFVALDALARALAGEIGFPGRVPVRVGTR